MLGPFKTFGGALGLDFGVFEVSIFAQTPRKGGRGCLMSPPCLESQGCHLIPLCYLLSCSSAQSCYPFCFFNFIFLSFSACWPFLLNFFQKILQYFSSRDRLFCVAPVQRLGEESWSVVCAACCHMTLVFAVMHLCNILEFFIAFVHSFFYTLLKKSGFDKSCFM